MESTWEVILPNNENLTIKKAAFSNTKLLKKLYIPNTIQMVENHIIKDSGISQIYVDLIRKSVETFNDNIDIKKSFYVSWADNANVDVRLSAAVAIWAEL